MQERGPLNPQSSYSLIINRGRRDNSTFSEAQRDLAMLREIERRIRRHVAA